MGVGFAAPPTLKTTAEIRSVKEWPEHQSHPLSLEGVVTLVDPSRNRVVIQDATGAVGFDIGETNWSVRPGNRVKLVAVDCWPFLPPLPRYPRRPDRWEWPTSFEYVPETSNDYFIDRYRGYIYPPTSGWYRFSIASDDSSHLMLGTDTDPSSRRSIAAVNGYTRMRDWNRGPSQRSEPVRLEAGKALYIEVVHHQANGPTHLSVAWEGPDLPQQVIGGRFLSPWMPDPALVGPETPTQTATASRRGSVLREVWEDATVDNLDILTAPRKFESTLSVPSASVQVLGPAEWPNAVSVHAGQTVSTDADLRWCSLEGTVEFAAVEGESLVLEISEAGRHVRAIVPAWRGPPPVGLRGRSVRVQGVGEALLTVSGERTLGRIWLPPTHEIVASQRAPQPDMSRRITLAELSAADPAALRDTPLKLVGRVSKQTDRHLTLSDAGTFSGYTSVDGATWHQLGAAIEIPMWHGILVGLAVNSSSTSSTAHAVFSNVQGFTRPPRHADIGGPAAAGQVRVSDNQYSVTGVGTYLWDSPDQFTFVYEPLDGPGEITARIDSFDGLEPNARAGLMMRESLATDAQYVDLVLQQPPRARSYSLQWRRRAEGSSPRSATDYTPRDAAPYWLKLKRTFHTIEVSTADARAFAPGEMVEAVGYIAGSPTGPSLVEATVRKLPREGDATPQSHHWRPLVELARLGGDPRASSDFDYYRVRGVVTFCGDVAGRKYLAVQDQTGGAFFLPRDNSNVFRPPTGALVEIHSNPGWTPPTTAPFAENLLVLGTASLPAPMVHPAEYLLPQRGEGSWIEIEGIVRSVPTDGLMEVKAKGEVFTVAVSGAAVAKLRGFSDALVRARGVIAFPNERERLLLVPSLEHVEVVEQGRADAFAVAAQPIRDLSAEALLNQSRHRTKISGTVTFADRALLFVQDDSGGTRVELEEPAEVSVADQVEVSGFPDWGDDDGAVLRHARVRRSAPGPRVIEPLAIDAGDTLSARLGSRLVRVKAVLSRRQSTGEGEVLELEASQRVFRAILSAQRNSLPAIPRGSQLELTGVGVYETGLLQWTKSSAAASSILPVKLLLRSAEDVVVRQKPRGWAFKRTLVAVGGIGAVILVASVWIQTLRRRVKQRTAELAAAMEKLRKETQMAATLAERDRLAGEIHDSLEQGFNGLLLQLEATSKLKHCPTDVRSGLTLAKSMVSFSRAEVQHAVWELQSPMLEDSELHVAVQKIVGQITANTLQATVTVEGTPRRLPSTTEHHVLRIAQEAINNAVKHASAQHLLVLLRYERDTFTLRVQDDGCGFVPTAVMTGGLGHFGLRSLRGRANKIHAAIDITSAPGQGTAVEVRVAATSQ